MPLWARQEAEGTPSEPYITFNVGSAALAMAGVAGEPRKYRRVGLDHMRRALASLPDGDPARAWMLAGLRQALAEEPPAVHPDDSPEAEVSAYMRDGSRERLDRAVDTLRAAVDAPRTEEPHRSRRRAERGQVLRMRFELTGEIADLKASIAVLETVLGTAVENAAPDDETLAATSPSWAWAAWTGTRPSGRPPTSKPPRKPSTIPPSHGRPPLPTTPSGSPTGPPS
ncbi:hypothetical protein ACFYN3_35685 [Streptomyces lavendulae]|uniref:hypothetical protein n=1 Tax=Streptomyces lavendulae TaxID=1914 RepID=UPI0033F39629